MTCNMNCFQCQYDDCIRPETQDVNEQKAEWRKNNPDKQKEIRHRAYLNHISSEKERAKKQYQEIKNNADKLSEYREYKRLRQLTYRAKKKAERVS